MTSCHGQAFIRIILLSHLSAFSEAVSLARLVKAEIVSPYCGILINTSVRNPTLPLARFLGNRQVFKAHEEAFDIHRLYKGAQTRLSPLRLPLPQLFQPRAPAPRFQLNRSKPPSHVRTQPSRPVGGLLCHRGGYHEASGGKIPDRGNPPQAPC